MIIDFLLFEKLQQAEKLYFNTNIISPENKKMILNITHVDNYTKSICDLFIFLNEYSWVVGYKIEKELRELHKQLKEYNKNVFPIKDFNLNDVDYYQLKNRKELIDLLQKLPSIAVRNLKPEIRQERNYSELKNYKDNLEYFLAFLEFFNNRDEKTKELIFKKMFKSGVTLSQLLNFVEEKENLLQGIKIDRTKIEEIINNNPYDLKKVYDNNDIIVVEVSDIQGIKDIGCNSLWCFTYGTNYQQWSQFSYNGIVYVIINLKENSESGDFMYVLISPLKKRKYNEGDGDSPLYDMTNYQIEYPIDTLKWLFGKYNFRKIFTFNYD